RERGHQCLHPLRADRQRERDAVDKSELVVLAREPARDQAEHSGILTSSSMGGSSSCARHPVAEKQRMCTSVGVTSMRRKFLKRGGSTHSKNSEMYLWKV